MRLKNKLFAIFAVLLIFFVYQNCVYNDQTHTYQTSVQPQPLGMPGVPGFSFPVDSSTVMPWLRSYDTVAITNHAWGIWAGLTAKSNQVYKGDTLLVYQTWLGLEDIAAICANGGNSQAKKTREKLSAPRQLGHSFALSSIAPPDTNTGFLVSVSYNPSAAGFAIRNLLLNQSTITNDLVPGGIGRIPAFPDTAITIKPTYFVGKVQDNLIRIPAWLGPPANTSQVYAPGSWNNYIFVDVTNSQPNGKIAVPVPGGTTNQQQLSGATVNLNEFISYPLDSAAANYINVQQGPNSIVTGTVGANAVAGDLAILICMHVATKEINNWTWQTFFWTLNPAQPSFPSSPWQAGQRPVAQLKGAAAHYAVATAYAMVWPNQPITGGTNQGARPIIAYNPYLEAGLSAPFGNTNAFGLQYGMQSNCMSCHVFAAGGRVSTPYSAAQYVDINNPLFNNAVQTDFLWSIALNLNPNK